MSFFKVQSRGSGAEPVKSISTTLDTNPTEGNLVCVGLIIIREASSSALVLPVTGLTIQDDAGNFYTFSPNSPAHLATPNISTAFEANVYLAYILSAPPNAGMTITASWGSDPGAFGVILVGEFGFSGGTPVLDRDAVGTGTGTTANLPMLTPTNIGELAIAIAASGELIQNITAPNDGAQLGVWTGAGGGDLEPFCIEYDLNLNVATPVNFTLSQSQNWAVLGALFRLVTNERTPYVQPNTGPPSPPVFNTQNNETSTQAWFSTLPYKNYSPAK